MVNRIIVSIGNTRISCGTFVSDKLDQVQYFMNCDVDDAARHVVQVAAQLSTKSVAVSSVVPAARDALIPQLKNQGLQCFEVSADGQTVVTGLYKGIGSDRIANAAAGCKQYAKAGAAIILDFGTATTLTAVASNGEFLGGLITLGVGKTFAHLHKSTAQLPNLESAFAGRKINTLAHDTEAAIIGGSILGHVGLIEKWVSSAKEALGLDATVVATGGYGDQLRRHTDCIDVFDPELTLKGINIIAAATTTESVGQS
jgi:type III pantothenate kinase